VQHCWPSMVSRSALIDTAQQLQRRPLMQCVFMCFPYLVDLSCSCTMQTLRDVGNCMQMRQAGMQPWRLQV
jgi:hypothetical protein